MYVSKWPARQQRVLMYTHHLLHSIHNAAQEDEEMRKISKGDAATSPSSLNKHGQILAMNESTL